MIMIPTTDRGHHCSSQARHTSGTPQANSPVAVDQRAVQVISHRAGGLPTYVATSECASTKLSW